MAAKPGNSVNILSTNAGVLQWDGTATPSVITPVDNGVLITSSAGVPSWLPNGTTGQTLVATTGSPPSWGSGSGSAGLFTASGNISSTTFKNINTTAVTLVAAQGSNTVIVPIYLGINLQYGGTSPFTSGGLITLNYPGVSANNTSITNSSYTGTTDQTTSYQSWGGLFIINVADKALTLSTNGGNPGGNILNDNSIDWFLVYYVFNISA